MLRKIRENHISNTSCTLVLVGAQTWGRKYVDWEIDATLQKEHALIGVLLPGAPVTAYNTVNVPKRLYDNIASGYASWLHWDHVTASATNLDAAIATAKLKQSYLINNTADRRRRNA